MLALCGVEDFAAALPEGADTRVGPDGRGLSTGQRARVMLARALLRKPVVLLLDEIETGLDAEGEAALEAALNSFEGTVVMATHEPKWIERCNRRWAMTAPESTVCEGART